MYPVRELVPCMANSNKPKDTKRHKLGVAALFGVWGKRNTRHSMAHAINEADRLGWLKNPPLRGKDGDLCSHGESASCQPNICKPIASAVTIPANHTANITARASSAARCACTHMPTQAVSKMTATK
jgi:hypothetical protein